MSETFRELVKQIDRSFGSLDPNVKQVIIRSIIGDIEKEVYEQEKVIKISEYERKLKYILIDIGSALTRIYITNYQICLELLFKLIDIAKHVVQIIDKINREKNIDTETEDEINRIYRSAEEIISEMENKSCILYEL